MSNVSLAVMDPLAAFVDVGSEQMHVSIAGGSPEVFGTFTTELHRLRGDLLNATGDLAAAERSYHQALAVAERQSAKLFELRAAASLARLWRDQDKRTEARDLLAPIYNWFTEGFETKDLKEAKALLDQLQA
jgi:predicted ATPase